MKCVAFGVSVVKCLMLLGKFSVTQLNAFVANSKAANNELHLGEDCQQEDRGRRVPEYHLNVFFVRLRTFAKTLMQQTVKLPENQSDVTSVCIGVYVFVYPLENIDRACNSRFM